MSTRRTPTCSRIASRRADVGEDMVYGTVLDNQKTVSVRGTFLQNLRYMDVFYREGYTDIEMEAGPYLSAVYEMYRPKRHPDNEIVNLYGLPFDLGILHYASDTPLGKGRNLGVGPASPILAWSRPTRPAWPSCAESSTSETGGGRAGADPVGSGESL